MQFPMFEYLKKRTMAYRDSTGKKSGTLLEQGTVTALAAGSAGSVAAVITTPIDVVKTRIMLSAADETGGEQIEELKRRLKAEGKDVKVELERAQKAMGKGRPGVIGVARNVLANEGTKALFRGGALRAVWTFLGSGLYLGVYESGRTYLENRRLKMDE